MHAYNELLHLCAIDPVVCTTVDYTLTIAACGGAVASAFANTVADAKCLESATTTLVVEGGLISGKKAVGALCVNGNECRTGVCTQNRCVSCTSSNDCLGGRCNGFGECVDTACGPNNPTGLCGGGKFCQPDNKGGGLCCTIGTSSCGNPAFCVDLQTNHEDCGTCGHSCLTGESCDSGICHPTCSSGLSACGNPPVCSNLQNDEQNCGTCGHSCPTGQTCSGGSCHPQCPSGQEAVNGACVNECPPGTTGQTCPVGDVCSAVPASGIPGGLYSCSPSATCPTGTHSITCFSMFFAYTDACVGNNCSFDPSSCAISCS